MKIMMKRGYFIPVIFLGLTSFVVLGTYKTSGGHPSSTGGPGESTCADATTGCHSDAVIKKDSTGLVNTFSFSASDSSYIPGQTYTISISASKTDIKKFGFEVVALKNSDNGNTGTWKITETTRTHTITGSGSLVTRKYVTHSTDGTPAVSAGLGKWTFNWTAPSSNLGKITFYYATSCTNNNTSNAGEQLFLSSFTIHPSATASIAQVMKGAKFNASYDPSGRKIIVNYNLNSSAEVFIKLVDLQGKQIQNSQRTNRSIGQNIQELPLAYALSKGVYLLNMEVNGLSISEKILVQ
jgi:hypothetical protein